MPADPSILRTATSTGELRRTEPGVDAVRTLTLDEQLSLLSGQNFWQTQAIERAGIRPVWLSDGTNGLRVAVGEGDNLGIGESVPSTCFPPASTLAASWNPALLREIGVAVGEEAEALGVGVVLGPGLNLKRHPLGGRNFEYYSEDPLLSGVLAAATVAGIQSTGTGACVKHFAMNNHERRRNTTDVIADERTKRELYLRGFHIAITESRPRMVMTAYNKIDGVYCSDDRWLLTDILRDEWGFDGVVVSDWGAEADRVQGVSAGMDLEMPGGHDRAGELRGALENGELLPADVARSAARVLGLQDLARPSADTAQALSPMLDGHDALARRAAAESTVVLTNDGILPLALTTRIALIGAFAKDPRFQGGGSALVNAATVTPAFDALHDAGVDLLYAPGYDAADPVADQRLIDEAVDAARSADVAVVMVGLPGIAETEGYDRSTLALPQQHDALVEAVTRANPRTVVLVSSGAPVLMPWRSEAAAVLHSYLGGQASGGAVADVLLGVVEPAGRLPETFPASLEDVASHPWFPGTDDQTQHREGLFVGYRHAVTAGTTSLFPFGHGLGYGRTTWSETSVSSPEIIDGQTEVTVSVLVSNTGGRTTTDLVQIYAHDRTGAVLRPRRELVGFARVTLRPGRTQRVDVEIATQTLKFWDVRTGQWQLPRGQIDLEVARSSEQIEAVVSVDVLDGVTGAVEPPSVPPIATADAQFTRRLGHPIPRPDPIRPFTRNSTLGDFAQVRVGRVLQKMILGAAEKTASDPVTLAMVREVTAELALRQIVLTSGGRMSWKVLDTLIALGNRRPLRAISRALQRQ
ncbi:glycoside hydrolase family 3 C-terminal domain-containing protein [Brachybacterium paraconglomeratum]|uniref:glycoside hydrolase family 3 C-terminal domain-containing protein n=1 Tax=Brachybacterium paraconglomeratum TaxID=173362 RepID=UPI0037C547D7